MIELRPYQQEARDLLNRETIAGAVTKFIAPIGAGRTLIVLDFFKNEKDPVVFVGFEELKQQWERMAQEANVKIRVIDGRFKWIDHMRGLRPSVVAFCDSTRYLKTRFDDLKTKLCRDGVKVIEL